MNGNLTMGSLFSGSGGFELAGIINNILPKWASEIEPYPIAVTKEHFPNMLHLGDICKINGGEIDPVDIITWGSPCQSLSVAGKREGIKNISNGDEITTKSGLFLEAIRIIKEMRENTNGKCPRYGVWENVYGAFSCNKGEDFRTVLQEIIKIVEPNAIMPAVPKNGWPRADCYYGDGWSIAYRTFDAQYWGVPQRRKRIYLVADFGGRRAREILFKQESLFRNTEESCKKWKEIATDSKRGTREPNLICYRICSNGSCSMKSNNPDSGIYKTEIYETLNTNSSNPSCNQGGTVICSYFSFQSFGNLKENTVSSTLCSRDFKDATDLIVKGNRVRKLMPIECTRLQGFPDDWGLISHKVDFSNEEYQFWLKVRNEYNKINGKKATLYSKEDMLKWYNKLHTDSAEYKMWGNGIALPCAYYVMKGIASC